MEGKQILSKPKTGRPLMAINRHLPRLSLSSSILLWALTFSASEMLADDLKVLGRATLVGEPTRGGANSVELDPANRNVAKKIERLRKGR